MRSRFALLAVLLVPSLARGAVAPQPGLVTGPEVEEACRKIKPCTGSTGFEELGAFCALARSGAPDAKQWAAAVVPTRAALRDAQCARVGAEALEGRKAGFAGTQVLAPTVNQSAILWGATDFLLTRAEEEMRQWAIDRFLSSICKDGKYARIGGDPIFPNSCDVLEGAHLAGFLPAMAMYQEAVRNDFAHLPVLATKHAALGVNGAKRDAGLVAMLLAHALEGQLLGAAPILSLQYAATRVSGVPLACTDVPFASRLFIVASLLASLQPASLSDGPLGGSVVLPKDDLSWSYAFMALAVNATDKEASPMAQVWPSGCAGAGASAKAAPFQVEYLHRGQKEIREAVDGALESAVELKKALDDPPPVRAEAYARISARLVSGARGLIAIFPEPTAGRPELDRVLDYVEAACRDLAGGRYARVALQVAGVSAYVAGKKLMPAPEFMRVTSFASEVAQASTPEQAGAAIERFAAPPGSYRRKRDAAGPYATVNAYVGGSFLTWERAQQASGGWHDARLAYSPGFWVPVGLEVGWAWRRAGSFGLFVHPLDLGVLASWRVKNDDLEARPVVGTKEVFAPGGAIVWGIPHMPISVAATVALAPKLRVLKEPVPGDEERNAVRFGVSVGVDIPIFP